MSDASVSLRGMILAAGYGSRLAPVTDHVPKPLLPVDGIPLLDLIIAEFCRVGVEKIGINAHHLADMVAGHVGRRSDSGQLTLFQEKEILGTGGALHGAREFLKGSPHFLLHNGDVLSDADLGVLVEDHLRSGALATPLLVDWPAVNSVALAENGSIASIGGKPWPEPENRHLTYSGIGVFSRRLLADIGPGFSSLIDPLIRAMEDDPGSVRGFAPGNVRWSDLGTLARYLEAQTDSSPVENDADLSVTRITGHGSDRRFWRLASDTWSAVAMVSPPGDDEFSRFISVGKFLGRLDLGAPTLLSESESEKTVLMEDVGQESLYSLVRANGFGSGKVGAAYLSTVDRLLEIQGATARARAGCPSAVDRRLDYDALRWETGYFRDRFLVGHLGLDPADLEPLDDDFHNLATTVSAQPLVLMHRDFQSQNLLTSGGRIRLVDFQGMRLGPLGYDLASLIHDPYVVMPGPLRSELVERFAAGVGNGVKMADVRVMVQAAGLQRVMQALGAYGYLGNVKGKRDFLKYISPGLAVLRGLLGDPGGGSAGQSVDPDSLGSKLLPGLIRLLATIKAPD
jgi:aminoglycoside/choline kinase family phosphotransferase/dTDP-glucose pyrophosphorylase